MKEEQNKMNITIYDTKLFKRFKKRAIDMGKSVTFIVNNLIRSYMDEEGN